MKHVTKLISVVIYILIMSFLLDFQLEQLFDVKQLCLVILGMGILFLPGYQRGESKKYYVNQLGRCALFASYIQTFILLFIAFSTEMTKDFLLQEIAKNCRPVLYGICLHVIFSKDADTSAKETDTPNAADGKTDGKSNDKEEPLTATAVYEAYRRLGLTNREAELAVQIERGFSNGEIAASLCISETTVKKHISNIFEKLEVNKREQIKEKRKTL